MDCVVQNGNTALHMAARFGHQSVVEVLAPLVDLPKVLAAANAEGKTPLLLACSQQSGGEAAVKYLLAADADKLAADLVRWGRFKQTAAWTYRAGSNGSVSHSDSEQCRTAVTQKEGHYPCIP